MSSHAAAINAIEHNIDQQEENIFYIDNLPSDVRLACAEEREANVKILGELLASKLFLEGIDNA